MHLLLCCTILQILPENTEEVEFIPAAAVIVVEEEEEEIEEVMVKSPSMLLQERQDRAEKSGQVVSLLDDDDDVVLPVVVVLSFEEIRSAMGFSPLNSSTNDSIPHDEDLLSWSLRAASPLRPSRRSTYDPIQIK